MSSFYTQRSQKCNKAVLNLTVFFVLLGSLRVKAARRTLVKLTLGGHWGYLKRRQTAVKNSCQICRRDDNRDIRFPVWRIRIRPDFSHFRRQLDEVDLRAARCVRDLDLVDAESILCNRYQLMMSKTFKIPQPPLLHVTFIFLTAFKTYKLWLWIIRKKVSFIA